MMVINLMWHHDAGHEWLQAPRSLIDHCGIADKISGYSYRNFRGDTVYLEGDCDAGLLIDELKALRIDFVTTDARQNGEWSFIRDYPCFNSDVRVEA